MEIKDQLPKFSPKRFDLGSWRLRVSGLVQVRRDVTYDEIMALARISLTDDFSCLEGWTVKEIPWEGVKLSSLLELLQPLPEARFVLLGADDFTVVLPLAKAIEDTTILALRIAGVPLDEYHGGPVRLVLRGQECYESVKGLNRIELLESYEKGTAAGIALSRLEGNPK